MSELHKAEITARIKQAREEAGLTQPEIAELLDVTTRTYQNYEDYRVPWGLMERISIATGRSTRWLLHGEEEPTAQVPPDLMRALREMTLRLDRIEAALVDDEDDSIIKELEDEEDDDQPGEQPGSSTG